MGINNKNFGEKIAALRKERGITQAELAQYLYCTPQTVSRWEVGNGTPELSILPKLASFFGVTVDDLLGITSVEKAEDYAAKYSVLRDDKSFSDAMNYINSCLNTIASEKANKTRSVQKLQEEENALEAEKVHLYLQQARQAIVQGVNTANAVISRITYEDKWYLPMKMQLLHFELMEGKRTEILKRVENEFISSPTVWNLYLYAEVLLFVEKPEEVLAIRSREDAKALMLPIGADNSCIWRVLLKAAIELEAQSFIEAYGEEIKDACDDYEQFMIQFMLYEMYKKQGNSQKVEEIKRILQSRMEDVKISGYIRNEIQKQL